VASLIVGRKFLQIISIAGYEINPINETAFGTVVGIVLFFVIVPYILGWVNLTFFTVPCIVILFSSWFIASLIYNHLNLGWDLSFFISQIMDTSKALPPKNWSIITATGSIFEEVLLRGIFLTMLLKRRSERKSIVLSASAFGGNHLFNLMNAPPTTQLSLGVFAQILFSTSYGLFYGYLFIKTQNLIPCVVMHYVGNGFISFFWYTPNASFYVYTILMLIFYIGLFPTILSILWVRYATHKPETPIDKEESSVKAKILTAVARACVWENDTIENRERLKMRRYDIEIWS
jgi:membrane protease YdiL (CAAX protease family)